MSGGVKVVSPYEFTILPPTTYDMKKLWQNCVKSFTPTVTLFYILTSTWDFAQARTNTFTI